MGYILVATVIILLLINVSIVIFKMDYIKKEREVWNEKISNYQEQIDNDLDKQMNLENELSDRTMTIEILEKELSDSKMTIEILKKELSDSEMTIEVLKKELSELKQKSLATEN